jgi:hypothetical protein
MITRYGDYCPAAIEVPGEGLEQMIESFVHYFERDVGSVGEQVARDQQHIGFMLFAEVCDTLNAAAQVLCEVHASESVAQVPVGCVNEAHEFSSDIPTNLNLVFTMYWQYPGKRYAKSAST